MEKLVELKNPSLPLDSGNFATRLSHMLPTFLNLLRTRHNLLQTESPMPLTRASNTPVESEPTMEIERMLLLMQERTKLKRRRTD